MFVDAVRVYFRDYWRAARGERHVTQAALGAAGCLRSVFQHLVSVGQTDRFRYVALDGKAAPPDRLVEN